MSLDEKILDLLKKDKAMLVLPYSSLKDLTYVPEKPLIMFITHAPFEHFDELKPLLSETERFSVWPFNYFFGDFKAGVHGDYFQFKTRDSVLKTSLREFTKLGFKNLFYVDVTEADKSISDRWADSISETAPNSWWSLMTLDPARSWFKYLKNGMVNLTQRFPQNLHGFAIDRIDRAMTLDEVNWICRLLDEVKTSSSIPLVYCANSFQDWQEEAAKKMAFLGSDGINMNNLQGEKAKYEKLGEWTSSRKFYLVGNPSKAEDFKKILEVHNFVFIDDYYLGLIDDLF